MRDALGEVGSALVLGGSSEIALATVGKLAERRLRTVVLAARRPEGLTEAVAQVRAAGATTVETVRFDATDPPAEHERVVAEAFDRHGDLDLVLVAAGVLGGEQEQLERNPAAARVVVETNFSGLVSATLAAADRLRAQGHGTLVVLSSVAGERARRSNFVYGASKAGLDAFAQGLGDALAPAGVRVVVVRPGFVHTRMTAGLDPAPLATTPDKVAETVVAAVARGSHTVWAPAPLRLVMAVLRHLPRAVFRRLPI